ncbi:Prephenate dehydrogenase [Mycena venus]|uniref:Prephenate dehydrogenase n=1 Tax=Mycena venus TaxID=2733690 RepID=A0A8H7CXH5_9AGAR|nr:Prephenate dehydrogenase [Mycena venus]
MNRHVYVGSTSATSLKHPTLSKVNTLLTWYWNPGDPNIAVFHDGYDVSRTSDFIIYSIEAEFIKHGDRVLPSLHGPAVSPIGQSLVLIQHRASSAALTLVEDILRSLSSRFVYLSYDEHDLVTANAQGVIHATFLSLVWLISSLAMHPRIYNLMLSLHSSMSTAWAARKVYPWEQGTYTGGSIETAKTDQFANSVTDLFKLMLESDVARFRERVVWAGSRVWVAGAGRLSPNLKRKPILLSKDAPHGFSLGRTPTSSVPVLPSPAEDARTNVGHISRSGPRSRLFGVAEHLFLSPIMVDGAIRFAMHDMWHRSDDLDFVVAARGWSHGLTNQDVL